MQAYEDTPAVQPATPTSSQPASEDGTIEAAAMTASLILADTASATSREATTERDATLSFTGQSSLLTSAVPGGDSEIDSLANGARVTHTGPDDQPALVPLPPPLWAGLFTIAALAVARLRGRGNRLPI